MGKLAYQVSRHLGENIAQLRKKSNLNQAQLSTLANVPRSTIAYLESGNANPALDTLLKVAQALKVSIEELTSPPRPQCHLLRGAEIPYEVRGMEGARIASLLPDKMPGFQIERVCLGPERMFVGTPHSPGTREYFVCLTGRIQIIVAGENFILESDDILSFSGDFRHVYKNLAQTESTGISVIILAPHSGYI